MSDQILYTYLGISPIATITTGSLDVPLAAGDIVTVTPVGGAPRQRVLGKEGAPPQYLSGSVVNIFTLANNPSFWWALIKDSDTGLLRYFAVTQLTKVPR